jgi:hypothetical protein
MSLGQLCTRVHPIAFTEFPLHIQTKYLRIISLLLFISQNGCKKSEFFSDKKKLAIEMERISATTRFKIALDELRV